ncbi:putative Zn finger-like uncharacterized protein [Acinetobacter calcoaceticus]|uniref:Putative Zn finger-like uncharacterized protein n=1 Tax=Acinetobacter calcoaceticus TaxID=471 RepID=A0A4R1XWU2_ACICA|nr:putative Zn finger-like uncharacterized protein [Acinetobacter calcoaceticus]
MSDKQTRCPTCLSIYKVTVPQLTVAQGWVCCPKCSVQFNALLHLLTPLKAAESEEPLEAEHHPRSFLKLFETSSDNAEQHVLDIFQRKAKHSNLDLRSYLNHLNYYHHNPIYYFPALNLAKSSANSAERKRPRHFSYYLIWGLVNTALVLLFVFQFLWFNPSLLDRSALLNHWFNKSCDILHCETVDQRYQQIMIENLYIEAKNTEQTSFTGVLINHYSKSLKLPKLHLSFQKNGQRYTRIISASEYLIDSLNGISRIPTHQPYHFRFTLTEPYNPSSQFKIQIIHP